MVFDVEEINNREYFFLFFFICFVIFFLQIRR